MTAATLAEDIERFLSGGGKIEKLPPQKAEPRKLQDNPPVRMVSPRLSPWQEERLEKAEALLTKLNISGNDPLATRGTAPSKTTSADVWAALARAALVASRSRDLVSHPTWGQYDEKKLRLLIVELQIYKHALKPDGQRDNRSHRILFTELLYLLLDRKKAQSWDVRKPKIIENMVLAAIRQVADPASMSASHRGREETSARWWAGRLGLSDHKDWITRWQFRYFEFLNDLTALDIYARDEIVRQL